MKKRVCLVLVMLILVLSSQGVVYAEETEQESHEEALALCETIGLLKGTGEGLTESYLSQAPKRYQGAMLLLRLQGMEETALASNLEGNYSDADLMTWEPGKNMLSYLHSNQDAVGFKGYSDGRFGPHDTMTAKQYLKVLLVALGYTEGTDFAWDQVGEVPGVEDFATEIGLDYLVGLDGFTLSDLGIASVEALETKVSGTLDSLGEILVDKGIVDETVAKSFGLIGISVAAETQKTATVSIIAEKEYQKEFFDSNSNSYKNNYYHTYELDMTVKLAEDGLSYLPVTVVETVMSNQAIIEPSVNMYIDAKGRFDSEEQILKDQEENDRLTEEAKNSAFGEALTDFQAEYLWTEDVPVITWSLNEESGFYEYTIDLHRNLYDFVEVTKTTTINGRKDVETNMYSRDSPYFKDLHDGVGLPVFVESDQKIGEIIEINEIDYEYYYTCKDNGGQFDIHYFYTAEGIYKGETIIAKGDFKMTITY